MSYQNVIYVDHKDRVVGSGTIDDGYQAGNALRIVRIFIFNSNGEMLLQLRSKNTPSSLRWDHSAGGHVDEGETYLMAAKRELSEEMGIKGVSLKRINKFYIEDQTLRYRRKRFNVIYLGIYDGSIVIDNDEVAGFKWISLYNLDNWILKKPEDFTAGFIISYKKLLNLKAL